MLFNTDGLGNFTAVTSGNIARRERKSFGAVVGDFAGLGRDDIYVLNWVTATSGNDLFLNNGTGGFATVSSGAAVAPDDINCPSCGAPVAVGAVTGDFSGRGEGNEILIFQYNESPPKLLAYGSSSGGLGEALMEVAYEGGGYQGGVVVGDLSGRGHGLDMFMTGGLRRLPILLLFDRVAGRFERIITGAAVDLVLPFQLGSDHYYDPRWVSLTGVVLGDFTNDGGALDICLIRDSDCDFETRECCPPGTNLLSACGSAQCCIQENILLINDGTGGFTTAPTNFDSNCSTLSSSTAGSGTYDPISGRFGSTWADSDFSNEVVGDFAGDGVADDMYLFAGSSLWHSLRVDGSSNDLLKLSRRCTADVGGSFGGDGYASRGFLCYPCPPYSTGSLGSNHCKYCPGGKVGPPASNGVDSIRGWKFDQEYACASCAAGRFRSTAQQTNECTLCPSGRYSTIGSSECVTCPSNLYTNVDGPGATACIKCPAGTEPAPSAPGLSSTRCAMCEGNTFSVDGECHECSAGKLADAQKVNCLPCPLGEEPVNGKCECEAGRYDSNFGLVLCFEREFHADRLEMQDMEVTRLERSQEQRCLPCPEECLECVGGGAEPVIKPGYSLSPAGAAIWTTSINRNTSTVNSDGSLAANDLQRQLDRALFLCPAEGRTCGNSLIDTASSDTDGVDRSRRLAEATALSLTQCAPGHGGALCGVCVPGWTGKFNQLCSECSQSGSAVAIVVIVVVAVIAAAIIYRWAAKAQKGLQKRLDAVRARYKLAKQAANMAQRIKGEGDSMSEMEEGGAFQSLQETLKIVLSNAQIISQFPATMEFSC
eukprot:COSAG02_NODE_4836_length_4923_cov_5.490257_3_plen_823_part_01